MPPNKKALPNWFECETCKANILHKDVEQHSGDCPPSLLNPSHYFIRNRMLYGLLDIKTNTDIKQISVQDKDHLVFLSQPAMQLCGFSMGQSVCVQDLDKRHPPYARIAWPTVEKTLVSVLLTKNALDLTFEKALLTVTVSSIASAVTDARIIKLVGLGGAKTFQLTNEISNRIHKAHLDKLLTEGNKIKILYFGKVLKFEVKAIESFDNADGVSRTNVNLDEEFSNLDLSDSVRFCRMIDKTKWILYETENDYRRATKKGDLLSQIGGLDVEIADIREVMNVALGIRPSISELIVCRGVLLYGASGTGKTMVANALAQESKCNVVNISSTNDSLTKVLEDAIKHAPSVVIIDEVDSLCPAKRPNDYDKKAAAAILKLFDTINESYDKVFVIATSSKPDSIDQALRRCRRLDREIEIPTPNPKARLAILQKLLQEVPCDVNNSELAEIANAAHGFVGADLLSLCSRAALQATTKISFPNLKYALTRISPSAMREVQIEVPDVKWSDIGGQEDLKLILRQAVEWPLKHPESFVRMGITPPRGVLMFGPPGCSKTMIAKALATESGLNFISIKGPELFSKWVGESERAVREVFHKARQVAPSVIFFDEIDALGSERGTSASSTNVQDRVLAQLLTELDGVTPLGDVTVLAATNRPDRIDKALLRPGRLDRIVYVPLPDDNTRREIFNLKFKKMPIVGIDVDELVALTESYSGAEVNALCHEAAMKALEESLDAGTVERHHFRLALTIVTPRTPSFLLKIYEDYVK